MNSEGLESECTVSGIMSFILRTSRVFGIAPVYFKKVHEGWRIRISRINGVYGKIVTVIFTLLSTVALFVSLWYTRRSLFVGRFITKGIMWFADISSVAVVIIPGSWTAMNRMRYLIDSSVKLQQINKEFQRYHQPSHLSEKKKTRIIVFTFIFGVIIVTMDYVLLFFVETVKQNKQVLTSSCRIFYTISSFTSLLVAIQLTLMVMCVLQTLELVNSGLQDLLQEIYTEKSTSSLTPLYPESILIKRNKRVNTFISRPVVDVIYHPVARTTNKRLESAPAALQRLSQHYCSVCDVIRQLNASSGLVLLLLYLSFLLHLIIVPYRVVVDIFQTEHIDICYLVVQVVWTLFYIVKLVMMTEPCHRTHEQMAQTKSLVNQLLRYSSLDDFATISELKKFYRHLRLNEPTITLKQFLPVDRILAATIISSITTYLVIAVQFL